MYIDIDREIEGDREKQRQRDIVSGGRHGRR